jgi:PKD repeat protein
LEWTGCDIRGNGTDAVPEGKAFAHPAPVADFAINPAPPAAIHAGEAVKFTNGSKAAGGASVAGALWDFGEGPPNDRLNPDHKFSRPGSYAVTLIAWDDAGRPARAARDVTVVP